MYIPNLVFESFVASFWAKLSFVATVWAKLQLGPHDPCRLGKAIIVGHRLGKKATTIVNATRPCPSALGPWSYT